MFRDRATPRGAVHNIENYIVYVQHTRDKESQEHTGDKSQAHAITRTSPPPILCARGGYRFNGASFFVRSAGPIMESHTRGLVLIVWLSTLGAREDPCWAVRPLPTDRSSLLSLSEKKISMSTSMSAPRSPCARRPVSTPARLCTSARSSRFTVRAATPGM